MSTFGLFTLHHLRKGGYERINRSQVLSSLDIDLLTRCVLMSSRVEAVREFRKAKFSTSLQSDLRKSPHLGRERPCDWLKDYKALA